jgi:hypothetical protein
MDHNRWKTSKSAERRAFIGKMKAKIAEAQRLAKPIEKAVSEIVDLMDDPNFEPFSISERDHIERVSGAAWHLNNDLDTLYKRWRMKKGT